MVLELAVTSRPLLSAPYCDMEDKEQILCALEQADGNRKPQHDY